MYTFWLDVIVAPDSTLHGPFTDAALSTWKDAAVPEVRVNGNEIVVGVMVIVFESETTGGFAATIICLAGPYSYVRAPTMY